MKLMLLALAMASQMASTAPTVLSKAAQDLIAPVHRAYLRVEAEQAKLPPPQSDRERLERLLDLDQAGREAWDKIDLSGLDSDQRKAAADQIWQEIQQHDLADQKALKAMTPANGWFTDDVYGLKAASGAFLIVQHAVNDPDLMRLTLARLEPLAQRSPIYGGWYALMYDRVALEFDHKPQRYGSQVVCKAGVWQPRDLEDPDHVDQRRKAVGLPETEAAYLKYFAGRACN